MPTRLTSDKTTAISVIIPTYNRPQSLKACLSALVKQSLTAIWEVVVVDDGSTSMLKEAIAPFEKPLNLRLIRQQNAGPAAARNNGVAHAKGEYIAFLDDDCEPHPDWLSSLYAHASPEVLVGGRSLNKLKSNTFSEASQCLVSFLYEVWQGTPWYFFTSNNFMIHRQSFLALGGFDEQFPTSAGEDREFCARLLSKGHELKYIPEALIDHAHHLTPLSFWSQHVKYGSAAVTFRKKLQGLGLTLPPARVQFYLNMLKYPWQQAHLNFGGKLALTVNLCLSQLATFTGYLKGRSTQ